jgi:flagellar export protein FliJ
VGWLSVRTQIVRLQQRRLHYVNDLGRTMRSVCSADVAQQAASVIQLLQSEQTGAALQLKDARQVWQNALDAWQQESQRVEALRALAKLHEQAENRLEERRERRLHDELSLRSAYAWQFAGRGDTGFMFPEDGDVAQELQA